MEVHHEDLPDTGNTEHSYGDSGDNTKTLAAETIDSQMDIIKNRLSHVERRLDGMTENISKVLDNFSVLTESYTKLPANIAKSNQ